MTKDFDCYEISSRAFGQYQWKLAMSCVDEYLQENFKSLPKLFSANEKNENYKAYVALDLYLKVHACRHHIKLEFLEYRKGLARWHMYSIEDIINDSKNISDYGAYKMGIILPSFFVEEEYKKY